MPVQLNPPLLNEYILIRLVPSQQLPLSGGQKIKMLLLKSKTAVNQPLVKLNNLPNTIVYFITYDVCYSIRILF